MIPMTDLKNLLEFIRTGFNKMSDRDPAFRASVSNFNKAIFFSIEDGGNYCFSLVNGHVPEIKEGTPLRYDVKVLTDTENLLALLSGKLDPTGAILTRKMRISGSLQDVAWLKRFLSTYRPIIAGIMNDYKRDIEVTS